MWGALSSATQAPIPPQWFKIDTTASTCDPAALQGGAQYKCDALSYDTCGVALCLGEPVAVVMWQSYFPLAPSGAPVGQSAVFPSPVAAAVILNRVVPCNATHRQPALHIAKPSEIELPVRQRQGTYYWGIGGAQASGDRNITDPRERVAYLATPSSSSQWTDLTHSATDIHVYTTGTGACTQEDWSGCTGVAFTVSAAPYSGAGTATLANGVITLSAPGGANWVLERMYKVGDKFVVHWQSGQSVVVWERALLPASKPDRRRLRGRVRRRPGQHHHAGRGAGRAGRRDRVLATEAVVTSWCSAGSSSPFPGLDSDLERLCCQTIQLLLGDTLLRQDRDCLDGHHHGRDLRPRQSRR